MGRVSASQLTALPAARPQTNAEIAARLSAVAQMLAAKGENPFKVRAYRRAAENIRDLPDSIDAAVRAGEDVTRYSGIGKGIAAALREIVFSGTLGQLEMLLATVPPEAAALQEYPRLDVKRVLRVYRKLGISTVDALKEKLAAGEIEKAFGVRMAEHFRQAFHQATEMLLYDADPIVRSIQRYLVDKCGARRAEPTGAFRRRTEVVGAIHFLVETDDFPRLVAKLQRFAGGTELLADPEADTAKPARLKLASGVDLVVESAPAAKWGVALIRSTGSDEHLEKLEAKTGPLARLAAGRKTFPDEVSVYATAALAPIPPELREGHDEVERAAGDRLPRLVTLPEIRGELHAHTTSSDGRAGIEEMAAAARERGYEYLGITDHSRSLKIAGGLTEDELWAQIRTIDRLNEKAGGVRLLKSSEVDILADGSLDYPDELLRELDYTVCSIHSRFRLGKDEQTERILRAMDNRYFNVLGHATGRLLLRRSGYDLDFERIVRHAADRGCFFEINASPDRLDLSPLQARFAAQAGVRIAVNTDAHSIRELDYLRCGIDVARRAGLEKSQVLNTLPLKSLLKALRR